MADGNLKRTKVSRGTGEIPKRLWKGILKKQLQVDEAYFNEPFGFKARNTNAPGMYQVIK